MKKVIFAIMFLLTLRAIVFAQECGPSCPVCSGSTDGSLLEHY